jgi:NADH:quinone reductase (non-electrogenic)
MATTDDRATRKPAKKQKRKVIAIIGGGFGGLYAAKALKRADVDVILLDKTNHHTFQPLLYQVATAGLSPADIATPIRRILRNQDNCTVLMAEVGSIDVGRKELLLAPGYDGDVETIKYDYLIVATGATHSYFGKAHYARLAPGLKTVDEALLIRQRIFMAYEAAEREPDEDARDALLTFVVVGAGPTGVEMAGALAEIAKKTLVHEFRRIDPSAAKIILLEGGDRILSTYPKTLSDKAQAALDRLGVDVRTNTRVTDMDDDGVLIGDERIASRTIVWAAGVAASPLARSLGAPLDNAGRVEVTPELTIPKHDNVYVIGDLASIHQEDGDLVPGVAPAAMQGGRHAAKNILRSIAGEKRLPFHYVDKGSLATIGRAKAVADLHFAKLSGLPAWLAWLLIHIALLIGFKNRFLVLVQWAWAYFAFDRGSRLIHGMVTPKRAEAPSLPASRRPALLSGVEDKAVQPPAATPKRAKKKSAKPSARTD